MNRRQFLTLTLATAGAAGMAIVSRTSSALAYRPLVNFGDGGGNGKGNRRRRRSK